MKNLVKIMRKPCWSFTLNVTMALCMSAIIGIGFLIKYTLVSGIERKQIYGQHVDLLFLNMNRHQWGTIHFILGLIFFGLLATHIFLHWKMITSAYQKLIETQKKKRVVALVFIIICTLLIILPFFVKPKLAPIKKGNSSQVTLVTDLTPNVAYLCLVK
jgi:uncharacterized membrane protein